MNNVVTGFQLKGLEKVLKLFPAEINLVFSEEYLWLYTNYLNVLMPNFGVPLKDTAVKVGDMLSFVSVVKEEEEYEVQAQKEKLIFEGMNRKVTLGLRYEPFLKVDKDKEVGTDMIRFDIKTMVRLSKYCSIQLVDLFSLVWIQQDGYYAGTGSIIAHVPNDFKGLQKNLAIGFPKFLLVGLESLLTSGNEEFIIDREVRMITAEVIVEGVGNVEVDARIVKSESLFSRSIFDLQDQDIVAEVSFTSDQIEVMKRVVTKETIVNFRYNRGTGLCLEFKKENMIWEEKVGNVNSFVNDFEFQIDGIDFRTIIEECQFFQYDGRKLKGIGEDIEVVCGTLA